MIDRNTVLISLAPYFRDDPRYQLIINDSGFGKHEEIRAMFPPRVFNFGIMEQATVGIAAGMAESGLIPVVYSIASFLVYRALDQIYNAVVLQKNNVKLIGNGAGDYFKFLDESHWMRDRDKRILEVVGLPVYEPEQFKEWIESPTGGYLIC
jgi:transketolase